MRSVSVMAASGQDTPTGGHLAMTAFPYRGQHQWISTLAITTRATKTVLRRATAAGGAARIATTNETTSGTGQRPSRATETTRRGTSGAGRESRANRVPQSAAVMRATMRAGPSG